PLLFFKPPFFNFLKIIPFFPRWGLFHPPILHKRMCFRADSIRPYGETIALFLPPPLFISFPSII
ncbi:MAG: hypothetical protein LUI85_10280, partial [Bacteroides sp.]|nr:hypothetical protein [Bacteroides sp.]